MVEVIHFRKRLFFNACIYVVFSAPLQCISQELFQTYVAKFSRPMALILCSQSVFIRDDFPRDHELHEKATNKLWLYGMAAYALNCFCSETYNAETQKHWCDYLGGATALTIIGLSLTAHARRNRSRQDSQRILKASILYYFTAGIAGGLAAALYFLAKPEIE